MKEIKTAVEALKKSPLFNLSLASKELFHSNFLAWVIEKNDDRAKNLLLRLTPDLPLDWSTLRVEREKNNFDLTVELTYSDETKEWKEWIVIENKVKSIPTQEQLDQYSSKLEKRPKAVERAFPVLLSLTCPDFFNEGRYESAVKAEGLSNWRYCGYDMVFDCLEEEDGDDPYHAALIEDYKFFVQSLIGLQIAVHDTFERSPEALINPFDWPAKKDDSLYATLKEIRMHDIFEKWRMRYLEKELKKVPGLDQLDFEVGFSRGCGMLNILPKDRGNKLFYCVTCQGTQLRQVLVKPDGLKIKDGIFKKALADLEKGVWFLGSNNKELDKCGKEENHYFCRYGDNFAYRYETLSNFARLEKVARDLRSASAP